MRNRPHRPRTPRNRQTGGLTIFIAVIVLVLLLLMSFYAIRVGVFEQRVSANVVRQKTAFHAAESAIEQGVEYMLANGRSVLSSRSDEFADGAGGTTRDGWFASARWVKCEDADLAESNHPCGGATPMKKGSYYYDDPATDSGVDSLPVSMTGFTADVTARLSANICFVTLADPNATLCANSPSGLDGENTAYMVITMLGYGFSDCSDTTDVDTCHGAASVAQPFANFKNLAGAPVVPLTTKTTFPPTGTAEIVPNPNAGGIGVPVSVWANNNPSCSEGVAVTSSGNWATCELHEWYEEDAVPESIACGKPSCSCTANEAITFTATSTAYQGIDIVSDSAFPCDLFEFYFNVPSSLYQIIKDTATVLSSCDTLGPDSAGLYWISGPTCKINANTVVGSPNAPVIIVSAATLTKLSGGSQIYGVLYVFDGEDANATFDAVGTNTIYGAAIVDATMSAYQGTFQVIYSNAVLARADGINGLGAISGGWRDFGLPPIAW